ncbi:hypothetical protein VT84_34350 [Gemmata sp. SH-PL17]|nr:hypothetical protein VT84_34350 [Gemmata sp. SH-PL17]
MLLGIATSPTDKTAKLVYADWLEDRSDPRGEYVRLLAEGKKLAPRGTKRLATLRKKCSPAWLSVIGELHTEFADIKTRAEPQGRRRPKFRATCDRGLWDIQYSCDLMSADGPLVSVLAFLARGDIAPVIRSIRLDVSGTASGFMVLELKLLTKAKTGFAYLEALEIQGMGVTIGDSAALFPYEEGGQLAKILALAPRLKSLIGPSAPNVAFCKGAGHPLEVLNVRAGAGTQNFIRNLSRSTRFPDLRELVYDDLDGDTFPDQGDWTPFGDFVAFLRSPAMAKVDKVQLTGIVATPAQIRELKKLRAKGLTVRRHPYAASAEDGADGEEYD